jgi:hypothetical protein
VNEETFKKNFSIFTENQFEGWDEWDNMVILGGSVVASLLPVPPQYAQIDGVRKYFHEISFPKSDIDVYFYGLDIDGFSKKVCQVKYIIIIILFNDSN